MRLRRDTSGAKRQAALLDAALFPRGAEFVAGEPGGKRVGVGGCSGDVGGEADEGGEAGEVPFFLELVLRAVVDLGDVFLGGFLGEAGGFALDAFAGVD